MRLACVNEQLSERSSYPRGPSEQLGMWIAAAVQVRVEIVNEPARVCSVHAPTSSFVHSAAQG